MFGPAVASLDYMHQHAPDADELEKGAETSAETLEGIGTTYEELANFGDALNNGNPVEGVSQAFGHLRTAWEARPDLESIRHLADVAEDVAPFIEHGEVLIPKLYGGLLLVMDNFASDEIAVTVGAMVAAILVA